jgi:hypothetical protein
MSLVKHHREKSRSHNGTRATVLDDFPAPQEIANP